MYPSGVSGSKPARSDENSSHVISGSLRNLIPYCAANDASISSQSSYKSYQVSDCFTRPLKSCLNGLEFFAHGAGHASDENGLVVSER